MIEGIDRQEYLHWNYDFFRIHRVIPPLRTEDDISGYRLSDLQIASLHSNPSFGRSVLATLLMRMYDALWIVIDDVAPLLVDPGRKTMSGLALHCHRSARFKHPETLGAGQ